MKLFGFTEKGLDQFLKTINAKGIKREDLVGIYPGLNSRFHAVYWADEPKADTPKVVKRGRPKAETKETDEINSEEFI